jgi:hypothetical protein
MSVFLSFGRRRRRDGARRLQQTGQLQHLAVLSRQLTPRQTETPITFRPRAPLRKLPLGYGTHALNALLSREQHPTFMQLAACAPTPSLAALAPQTIDAAAQERIVFLECAELPVELPSGLPQLLS